MFQAAAWLISLFYDLTNNYAIAIALVAVVIMLLITPLTLKSTKGMLEMQRLQPEMRRLQQQYRGDRQKLNEEMMKLYQEHKVNPLASCLPLLAQMPIFIIMFQVLHGLTRLNEDGTAFDPKYLNESSQLYQDLASPPAEMVAFGIDLAKRPFEAMRDNPFPEGVIYGLLVVLLAALYFVQQRMIASRTTSATMSPTQQKIMQYLPVFFAVFQLFFPAGLVVYYISQTIVRIIQQAYITRRFYRGEHSLGRQAQAASAHAREIAKEDGGGGGLFSQIKQEAAPKSPKAGTGSSGRATPPASGAPSKRVTPPKNRPTPAKGRPTPPRKPTGGAPSRPRPTPPSKKPK